MIRKTGCRRTVAVTLLISLLQASTFILAEAPATWNILGVEIDDDVLFDAEYIRQTIEDSRQAVVENLDFETVDGELRRIDVHPVVFSETFIPQSRFIGLPIVCGRYRSAKSDLMYRYIFLGSTAFTLVEEKNADFEPGWKKYCGRTR